MMKVLLPAVAAGVLCCPAFASSVDADSATTAAPLLNRLIRAHGLPEQFSLVLDNVHPGVAGTQTRIARLHHTYRGVRIWQSESVVTLDEGGDILDEGVDDRRAVLATTAIEGSVKEFQVTPALRGPDAIRLMLSTLPRGYTDLEAPRAELMIYPVMGRLRTENAKGKPDAKLNAADLDHVVTGYRLVYLVRTRMLLGGEQQLWDTIISADDAKVIQRIPAQYDVAAQGKSQYSGAVALQNTAGAGNFLMIDGTRAVVGGHGGLAVTNGDHSTTSSGQVYASAGKVWGDGLQYFSGGSTTGVNGQTAAADAMYGMLSTYDTMKNVMGWSSLDGKNTATHAVVHYGSNHQNAHYNDSCRCIMLGDGGGAGFRTVTAVDVVGHEMGHGVTANSSKLIYSGESGGLNESSSDINGEMAEAYARNGGAGDLIPTGNDWEIGKEIVPSGGALRYFRKPSRDGQSPDAWHVDIGKKDVHFSSGPNNRMFYFLSQGSDQAPRAEGYSAYLRRLPKAMSGIGSDKAYRIWFTANTTKFTAGTDYADARVKMIATARQLYGADSAEEIAVKRAYAATNVGYDSDEIGYQSPVDIQVQPASTGVTIGHLATFSVTAEAGVAPYSYSWYKNGVRVDGATGQTYSFLVTAADAGAQITVRVGDSTASRGGVLSEPATLTVNPVGTLYEQLANGDFEQGALGWNGDVGLISQWWQQPAHQGKKSAWLGDPYQSSTDVITTQVAIPAGSGPAKLSFAVRITTSNSSGNAVHRLVADLRGQYGMVLRQLAQLSNLDAGPDYVVHTFDVSELRGQTLRLRFTADAQGWGGTSFSIDTVSLKTE